MVNIQYVNDNECFKWCLVKYLHAHNSRRIRKADKDLAKKLDFADIQFPVRIKDIQKLEKEKNCSSISVFGYVKKEKYPSYMSKNTFKKHAGLLLIGKKTRGTVLIKGFNTFMYDHTLYRERNQFCRYCLQAFI